MNKKKSLNHDSINSINLEKIKPEKFTDSVNPKLYPTHGWIIGSILNFETQNETQWETENGTCRERERGEWGREKEDKRVISGERVGEEPKRGPVMSVWRHSRITTLNILLLLLLHFFRWPIFTITSWGFHFPFPPTQSLISLHLLFPIYPSALHLS